MDIFHQWSKWVLVEKNVPHIKEVYASPILGSYLISKHKVVVDLYRKQNKKTGKAKYKRIEQK
jgi:hypothetical protein